MLTSLLRHIYYSTDDLIVIKAYINTIAFNLYFDILRVFSVLICYSVMSV